MVRYAINPPELKNARSIGYNHAIIAEREFYMAGQVPMDSDSNIIGSDIKPQTERVYNNIEILLDTIGKSYDDVMKVTTHIIRPKDNYFDGYKEVYENIFDPPYPCHTVLGHEQLAHEDYLVEVEIDIPISREDIDRIVPDGDIIRKI